MGSNKNITSVDIINAALATPFTKEGRVRMGKTVISRRIDEKEFLENCYVHPDFISPAQLASQINSGDSRYCLIKTQDYEHFAYREDIQKHYKYNIKYRSEKAQKEHFEKDLLGIDLSNPERRTYSTIFLIEGPAGCGKTTYANYLLQNNFSVDMCDVETATQRSCSCFARIYDFCCERLNPITAIEMLLLSQIHKRLAKNTHMNENEYEEYLKNICNLYFNSFVSENTLIKDSPEYREFFGCLKSFCNHQYDYKELSNKLYTIIHKYISETDRIINGEEPYDEVEAIKFLLGIIARTYFCLSSIYGEKYILFLDNIERFIVSESGKPYIAVFDTELQKILNSFYSTADEIEDLIYKSFSEMKRNENDEYKTTFGILLAVRESTLDLLKSNHVFAEYFELHHSENIPTYVNISNWFDYYQILMKKVRYFQVSWTKVRIV